MKTQMGSNCEDSEVSLLTKFYLDGTLPPEVDNEGNIEYKVSLGRFWAGYFINYALL